MTDINFQYKKCQICPRKCNVNRASGEKGYCNETAVPRAARAALHFWEEPCISGDKGSGAVFFTGCNLGCVFCQNYEISHDDSGKDISSERLVEIFFELKEKKANNINLVTGDIFIPTIIDAIESAKKQGFSLPFVFNTSSYLNVDSIRALDGLIDIYLPDFKYWKSESAKKYSDAADYPQIASDAIAEMYRQQPVSVFGENGLMKKGVLVRHLLMPHGLLEAKIIVKYLYDTYGDDIYISLMNQYTPDPLLQGKYPEISKSVSEREYDELINYAVKIGLKNGFMQECGTVSESFIPQFDYEGI